jgi:hypothetical protein
MVDLSVISSTIRGEPFVDELGMRYVVFRESERSATICMIAVESVVAWCMVRPQRWRPLVATRRIPCSIPFPGDLIGRDTGVVGLLSTQHLGVERIDGTPRFAVVPSWRRARRWLMFKLATTLN